MRYSGTYRAGSAWANFRPGCQPDSLDSRPMGKYRGGSKSSEEDDEEGKKLDPRQFPELNAVFYTARPSEFIKMRVDDRVGYNPTGNHVAQIRV
jgi:hypothetical protein